jgi:hypothetical protein
VLLQFSLTVTFHDQAESSLEAADWSLVRAAVDAFILALSGPSGAHGAELLNWEVRRPVAVAGEDGSLRLP